MSKKTQTVELSFVDLVWMLQPVPVGTPHALPALGTPQPWWILPAPLAQTNCPWDRAPNKETERLERMHAEAARNWKALEKAKADARDPAAVRAEQNRKKKARKLASKARKEAAAEAGEAGREGQDGDEGNDGASISPAATPAPAAPAPAAPAVAYALPPYLADETHAAFIEQYSKLHADFDDRRWQEAEVVMPEHLRKRAVWGNTYIYPREHPDDPQRGIAFNQKTLTFEYHCE
ncbi:hypothetical protein Rhopal_004009-T1 [Rhodotorula paludigena]|uniref:Uncharacterized protein n=1 Tax=Rhodotorula paludigena TaxID=86838 RepID=A0AAV5GEP0_9BASI|nr:hypothetical protein Rhopal_004009-T1 [Rhodotorula paludigena]